MIPVNLAPLTTALGNVPRAKTLSQIIDETRSTRGALNPYAIIANKIMTELKTQFEFPFLQPQVINPLELTASQEYYLHRKNKLPKFESPRMGDTLHMDAPAGVIMCIEREHNEGYPGRGLPFFVVPEDISTTKGSIEYRVSNHDSFKRFVHKLTRDMSFLRPMVKQKIIQKKDEHTENRYKVKKGDIVYIPGQPYGKIGVVRKTVNKEYTARLWTEEGMHSEIIGVNLDDLETWYEMGNHLSIDFREELESSNISWLDKIPKSGPFKSLFSSSRLPIGAAAVYMGMSNTRKNNIPGPLGRVSIRGYYADCAVVVPHSFDEQEFFPWGKVKELPLPIDQVVSLGSVQQLKKGDDIYAGFFADDVEISTVIEGVTRKEIDDPHTRSLVVYNDFNRYRNLETDLRQCPEVPSELVAPQFVSILTESGVDGIEWLARMSDSEVVEVAGELLANDIREAKRDLEFGKEKYGTFVKHLNDLTQRTTPFRSIEELLKFAGPQANLYQMKRDGTYTLAYIRGVEYIRTGDNEVKDTRGHNLFGGRGYYYSKDGGREDQLDDTSGYNFFTFMRDHWKPASEIDQDKYRENLKTLSLQGREVADGRVDCRFLDKDELPDGRVIESEDGHLHALLAIRLNILRKKNTIRYGRDEHFDMTDPGLEPISYGFKLHPIVDDFQLEYLKKVFQRIADTVEFEGKMNFFTALGELVETTEKEPHDENEDNESWLRRHRHVGGSLDVGCMSSIQSLYNGIRQLTNNPDVKNEIVIGLLQEEPLLLEAYYDFEGIQKMMMIRDHWFRGHEHEKALYLRQFGYIGFRGSYAKDFYAGLRDVDMFHRGHPHDEFDGVTSVTRNAGSYGRDQSSLGLVPAPSANLMLETLSERAGLLTSGVDKEQIVGFLTEGNGKKTGNPKTQY